MSDITDNKFRLMIAGLIAQFYPGKNLCLTTESIQKMIAEDKPLQHFIEEKLFKKIEEDNIRDACKADPQLLDRIYDSIMKRIFADGLSCYGYDNKIEFVVTFYHLSDVQI
jgi:hypothetical protein